MKAAIRKRFKMLGVAIVAAAGIYSNGASADIVADGEKLFKRCGGCHSLEDGKNKTGPSLAGMIGRTAGTAPKYKYSKLNQSAGENGLVWDEETIVAYLIDPTKFLKNFLIEKGKTDLAKGRTKMVTKTPKEDQRRAVAAYLASLNQ